MLSDLLKITQWGLKPRFPISLYFVHPTDLPITFFCFSFLIKVAIRIRTFLLPPLSVEVVAWRAIIIAFSRILTGFFGKEQGECINAVLGRRANTADSNTSRQMMHLTPIDGGCPSWSKAVEGIGRLRNANEDECELHSSCQGRPYFYFPTEHSPPVKGPAALTHCRCASSERSSPPGGPFPALSRLLVPVWGPPLANTYLIMALGFLIFYLTSALWYF